MKIAQVTHNYLPHIGGLEFYVKRLVDSLKEHGTSADVLTTDLGTSEPGRKSEAIYFKTSFAIMRNPFSLDYIKYLRKNKYDILHVHSVWFIHGLIAVYYRNNARIITTIHGVYPEIPSIKLRFFLGVYKYFVSYILSKSEKVLVYSEIEKVKLLKLCNVPTHKIVVLPMAIQIDKYEDQLKDPVILFTGRIISDKNPEVLIKAVGLLDKRFQYFKLVFVGPVDDAYKHQLMVLSNRLNITNEIIFVGPLDPSVEHEKKQLMAYYKNASVFVSLGSWEGQPTRLMEAMQYKTPVIAYAAGGTADFIVDNENGIVMEKLDAVELAKSLGSILSDENLAKRIGNEARTTIENGYSWNKIFDVIIELYKEVQAHN